MSSPQGPSRAAYLRVVGYQFLMYLTNRVVCSVPCHAARQWFYRRLLGLEIGSGSSLHMGAWIDGRGRFRMGCNSVINQNCRLDNRAGISIGDNVSISADVIILTADHDVQSPDFAGRQRPVVIEDWVFVGTRAMILPGVTLGVGSVVAAGAVVTKDVPQFSIVAGVPARPIGERSRDLRYQCSWAPHFS